MKKLSQIEVQNRIDKAHGKGEFILLGKYINRRTKTLVKHIKCGYVWKANTETLINGFGCPNCANNQQKSHDEFVNEVRQVTNGEYEVLSRYKSNKEYVRFKHNKCGHEFNMTPKAFLKGQRCPNERYKKSAKSNSMTLKEANKRMKISTNNEYEIVGDYVSASRKARIKHKECGNIFMASPTRIFNLSSGCPICKSSHGETYIKNFLDENNINYKTQFRLDECRNVRPLPFDFAIFNIDGTLQCLIEFDGEQHIKPKFGIKEFERTKKNDLIKNEFCLSNNIKLIRIPYKRANSKKTKLYIYNILFNKLIPSQA